MTPEQLIEYDRLLNDVDNEWDIYYWATGNLSRVITFNELVDYTAHCYTHIVALITGAKPVPTEWDSPVLRSLQEHIREKKLVPKGVAMS